MKNGIFLLLCIAITLFKAENVFAQESIITDRPDMTEASYLVPVGWLQIEAGAFVDNANANEYEFVYNTTLIRYGISESIELRLLQDYLGYYVNDTEVAKGLSPFGFGAKITIAKESGWIPETAIIGHLFLKTGEKAFRAQSINPQFRFTFANSLPNEFALSYNFGAEWDGATTDATAIYTLSLARNLFNSICAYVEIYGFVPENSVSDHRF